MCGCAWAYGYVVNGDFFAIIGQRRRKTNSIDANDWICLMNIEFDWGWQKGCAITIYVLLVGNNNNGKTEYEREMNCEWVMWKCLTYEWCRWFRPNGVYIRSKLIWMSRDFFFAIFLLPWLSYTIYSYQITFKR